MKLWKATASALALLVCSSSVSAGVSFNYAQLSVQLTAGVSGNATVSNNYDEADDFTKTPLITSGSETRSASGSSATSSDLLSTEFESPAAGGVIFEVFEATRVAGPTSDIGSASALGNFQYTFTSDTPFSVQFNYGVTFTGYSDGSVSLFDANGDGNAAVSDNIVAGGTFNTGVYAAGKYFIDVGTYAGASPVRGNNSSISGRISFAVLQSAVPEPATWMLMLVGFGLAGAGVRSQRRRAAVASA